VLTCSPVTYGKKIGLRKLENLGYSMVKNCMILWACLDMVSACNRWTVLATAKANYNVAECNKNGAFIRCWYTRTETWYRTWRLRSPCQNLMTCETSVGSMTLYIPVAIVAGTGIPSVSCSTRIYSECMCTFVMTDIRWPVWGHTVSVLGYHGSEETRFKRLTLR